jgi:hypothetical protein
MLNQITYKTAQLYVLWFCYTCRAIFLFSSDSFKSDNKIGYRELNWTIKLEGLVFRIE